MSDVVQQLANYQTHFDRAINRGAPSPSHVIESTDEGAMVVVDFTTREPGTDEGAGARRLWRLSIYAAAAILLIVGVVAVLNRGDESVVTDPASSADGAAQAASTPEDEARSVIEGYVAAYNSGDLDATMAYFNDTSRLIDHPFMGGSVAEGLDQIEALMRTDFSMTADGDAYTITNVVVSGNTVTWDHEWTNSQGNRSCREGNTAVVEGGVIVSWTFPPTGTCA